jgi:putative ABC transport system ATP-binding protein
MLPSSKASSPLVVNDLCYRNRGPYTFSVDAGSCAGLTGPSGAGKSLLLRAIADLDPHTGEISLGGLQCSTTEAPFWRRTVGMLPAESGWWADQVGSHFNSDHPLAEERFHLLGFDRSVLNWPVSRLSTGEKQRLAILRLLHNEPRALLLDEPTASLDAANIARTEQLLRGYWRRKQIPVLLVSHDREQLSRLADRTMIIAKDGALLFAEESNR